jgi:hypothetical protein
MAQHEFHFRQLHEAPNEEWQEMTPFEHVRITREHENGVMVSGVVAETLPHGLRILCVEAMARYRAATGQEPSWLFINNGEQKIVVR